ncbi:hypothetical protein F5878DRAFT_230580 [Lentinula raphanica]|uniref:Uncharacterized protein n=1 Tax=Lentinula raphanica TaxID=153919 RepID=A0AA38UDA6_9AGAR|nr:hypothetical protein F5878DRAFT_230580 [Lentinula raphanica]
MRLPITTSVFIFGVVFLHFGAVAPYPVATGEPGAGLTGSSGNIAPPSNEGLNPLDVKANSRPSPATSVTEPTQNGAHSKSYGHDKYINDKYQDDKDRRRRSRMALKSIMVDSQFFSPGGYRDLAGFGFGQRVTYNDPYESYQFLKSHPGFPHPGAAYAPAKTPVSELLPIPFHRRSPRIFSSPQLPGSM